MSWVAVAIGGSAVVGGGFGAWGASKAAGAQSDAARNALAYEQQTDAANRARAQPFVDAGASAVGKLGQSYADPGSFTNTADYKFAFDRGRDAMENSAAARGGLLGGNAARGAVEYGQNFATTYLDRYRQGLLGVAGMGANAATGASNNASTMSGQVGGTYGALGQGQASGWVGGANAISGSLGSGVSNYLFANAMNRSSFGGGGGGGYGTFGGNGGAGWNGNGRDGSAF